MEERSRPPDIPEEEIAFSKKVRRRLSDLYKSRKWLADELALDKNGYSRLRGLINLGYKTKAQKRGARWGELKARVAALLEIDLDALARRRAGATERVIFKFHPPITGRNCAGRGDDVADLEKARKDSRTKIIGVIGPPGVGKSTLVEWWKDHLLTEYIDCLNVVITSFPDEKAAEGAVTADGFVARALKEFGDNDPLSAAGEDNGRRLFKMAHARPTFLWLDGLEALQEPSGQAPGRIRDEAIRALLLHLVEDNPGLCVVTSRLPLLDLAPYENSSYTEIVLGNLSEAEGAELLCLKGVKGDEGELKKLSGHYGGHCLTLDLIGGWLCLTHNGDVGHWRDLKAVTDAESGESRVAAILRVYKNWLGKELPEALDLLRVVCLFDRPADQGAVAALLRPPICGLTDRLAGLAKTNWGPLITKLRLAGLLSDRGKKDKERPEPETNDEDLLDAHAWVRDYFRDGLRRDAACWKEGNTRLAKFFEEKVLPRQPDGDEHIHLLYSAVRHYCEAGLFSDALKVYRRRINREPVRGRAATERKRMPHPFAVWHLGLYATDLAALKAFFEPPWDVPRPGLTPPEVAYVRQQAGLCLRLLGRYEEARNLTARACEECRNAGDRPAEVTLAAYLAELHLLRGDFTAALAHADRSVMLADRCKDTFRRVYNRGIQGDILHEWGRPGEARKKFQEAEKLQKKLDPSLPYLASITAYRYLDLLFSEKDLAEVNRLLNDLESHRYIGQTDLDLACQRMFRAIAELAAGIPDNREKVRESFTAAIEDILRVGIREGIVIALLQRAEVRRAWGEAAAEEDLKRAVDMAHWDGAILYEAQARLALADLMLTAGEKTEAGQSLRRVRYIFDKTECKRRLGQLEDLERLTGGEELDAG